MNTIEFNEILSQDIRFPNTWRVAGERVHVLNENIADLKKEKSSEGGDSGNVFSECTESRARAGNDLWVQRPVLNIVARGCARTEPRPYSVIFLSELIGLYWDAAYSPHVTY